MSSPAQNLAPTDSATMAAELRHQVDRASCWRDDWGDPMSTNTLSRVLAILPSLLVRIPGDGETLISFAQLGAMAGLIPMSTKRAVRYCFLVGILTPVREIAPGTWVVFLHRRYPTPVQELSYPALVTNGRTLGTRLLLEPGAAESVGSCLVLAARKVGGGVYQRYIRAVMVVAPFELLVEGVARRVVDGELPAPVPTPFNRSPDVWLVDRPTITYKGLHYDIPPVESRPRSVGKGYLSVTRTDVRQPMEPADGPTGAIVLG